MALDVVMYITALYCQFAQANHLFPTASCLASSQGQTV